MDELQTLLDRAGLRPRGPATPAALADVEAAFGFRLPAEFVDLWSLADGMAGDGIDILPLDIAGQYATIFDSGLGYVPFTECNDSNPYSVCCRDPLRGVIAHVFHDGPPLLVCRSLGRFLELVAVARREGGEVDRLDGDFAIGRPDRTPADVELARDLVRAAAGMDARDPARGDALRFATQLFGPGQEAELADMLALGDEYTRSAVLQRWAGLGTPAALDQLQRDAAAYREFMVELRQAFERAGMRTEPYRDGEFLLQPGRVGLNFAMLFADCRRPGAMAEWVERLKSRHGQPG
jgi:hypothetical protein